MNDLRVLDAHAAFVDVGSEQMFVSIAGKTLSGAVERIALENSG